MKVLITEVKYKKLDEYYVNMQSEIGSIKAIWIGKAPYLGKYYSVEIEIREVLTWGQDIILRKENTFRIFEREGKKHFWSQIGLIDNTFLVVKIQTSLLKIDTRGEPIAKNGFLELVAENVFLFDENI